jgi:hypothetical protein
VWWNLADGAAFREEGRFRGGLLDENLNPKPAYEALDRLLNDEWKTRASAVASETFSFRGFYGRYQVTLQRAGQQSCHEIHLAKGAPNQFELRV